MKTNQLRTLIAAKAVQYAPRFVGDRAAIEVELATAKRWKRRRKCKLSTFLREQTHATVADLSVDPYHAFDHVDVIHAGAELSEDCVARHFEHDDFEDSLDCLVVTTPDDTTIVGLFWHSD